MDLQQRLRHRENLESQPRIFNLASAASRRALNRLLKERAVQYVTDNYKEQLLELFGINHPSLYYSKDFITEFGKYYAALTLKRAEWQQGRWVYYPWSGSLVHILEDNDFQKVRTARNRNLITEQEQKNFFEGVVGIGGLSIGNSVALAIVLQGGGRHVKLADPDRLELTNTNRIRTKISDLGLPKVVLTARQIYELNPYAKVELFPEGLTETNIDRFFKGPPALEVMVDELDNLAIKYLIRKKAKKYRVPVVMAADNGDNGVVDVERYDQKKQPAFFHNRLGRIQYEVLKKLNKFSTGRLITKHVGLENVTPRMLQSLTKMGKTIVSWPQLGGTALVNGAAVSYCVRKILNGQPLENNRAIISLDQKLDKAYFTKKRKYARKQSSTICKKIFNL